MTTPSFKAIAGCGGAVSILDASKTKTSFVALKTSNVTKNMPLICYALNAHFPFAFAACRFHRRKKKKP